MTTRDSDSITGAGVFHFLTLPWPQRAVRMALSNVVASALVFAGLDMCLVAPLVVICLGFGGTPFLGKAVFLVTLVTVGGISGCIAAAALTPAMGVSLDVSAAIKNADSGKRIMEIDADRMSVAADANVAIDKRGETGRSAVDRVAESFHVANGGVDGAAMSDYEVAGFLRGGGQVGGAERNGIHVEENRENAVEVKDAEVVISGDFAFVEFVAYTLMLCVLHVPSASEMFRPTSVVSKLVFIITVLSSWDSSKIFRNSQGFYFVDVNPLWVTALRLSLGVCVVSPLICLAAVSLPPFVATERKELRCDAVKALRGISDCVSVFSSRIAGVEANGESRNNSPTCNDGNNENSDNSDSSKDDDGGGNSTPYANITPPHLALTDTDAQRQSVSSASSLSSSDDPVFFDTHHHGKGEDDDDEFAVVDRNNLMMINGDADRSGTPVISRDRTYSLWGMDNTNATSLDASISRISALLASARSHAALGAHELVTESRGGAFCPAAWLTAIDSIAGHLIYLRAMRHSLFPKLAFCKDIASAYLMPMGESSKVLMDSVATELEVVAAAIESGPGGGKSSVSGNPLDHDAYQSNAAAISTALSNSRSLLLKLHRSTTVGKVVLASKPREMFALFHTLSSLGLISEHASKTRDAVHKALTTNRTAGRAAVDLIKPVASFLMSYVPCVPGLLKSCSGDGSGTSHSSSTPIPTSTSTSTSTSAASSSSPHMPSSSSITAAPAVLASSSSSSSSSMMANRGNGAIGTTGFSSRNNHLSEQSESLGHSSPPRKVRKPASPRTPPRRFLRDMTKHILGTALLSTPFFHQNYRGWFISIEGYWFVISFMISLQSTREATGVRSWLRTLGTIVGCGFGALVAVVSMGEITLTVWRCCATILATAIAATDPRLRAYPSFLALFIMDVIVLCRYGEENLSATVRLAGWRALLNIAGSLIALVLSRIWPNSSGSITREALARAASLTSEALTELSLGYIAGPGSHLSHIDFDRAAEKREAARAIVNAAKVTAGDSGVSSRFLEAVTEFDRSLAMIGALHLRLARAAPLRDMDDPSLASFPTSPSPSSCSTSLPSTTLANEAGGGYTDWVHTIYIAPMRTHLLDVIEATRDRMRQLSMCLATNTAPPPLPTGEPLEIRAMARVYDGFFRIRSERYAGDNPPPLLPLNDVIRLASFIHLLSRLGEQAIAMHKAVDKICRRNELTLG